MATEVIKVDGAQPDIGKIEQACRIIDSGGLVAFPTETVYGIGCRVKSESLARLDELKSRDRRKYYTLHIGQKDEVKKYVPSITLRAQKLIGGSWPGPLTVVFELSRADISRLRNSLDKEIFENLYKDNTIGIRCPDNPVAAKLLQNAKNAVVAPSANVSGQRPATSAADVICGFSGKIDLVLDGGECKYQKNSTVVKIDQKGLKILREGVYSQNEVEKLAEVKILFVCTGNTCRSPMAEGIFAKYLAKKLKCDVDQLAEKGYKMCSAGTMGISGVPASAEAVTTCANKGIEIRNHKSTALSAQLIKESDLVFGMSRAHCQRIIELCPEAADKCVLLSKQDIFDPIGQPQQVYDRCADEIENAIQRRISELVI